MEQTAETSWKELRMIDPQPVFPSLQPGVLGGGNKAREKKGRGGEEGVFLLFSFCSTLIDDSLVVLWFELKCFCFP